MFVIIYIVIHLCLTRYGQSLNFYPLLASNGSSLCAVENPAYAISTEDILGIPPGVPGSVKCSFYCVGMNSKVTCSGFNYLVRESTLGTCQFYSQPPSACRAKIKGCMYYEVSSLNQQSACKPLCASSPCLNNGTCVESVGGFNCTCLSGLTGSIMGFEGTRCEILITNLINIPGTYNYVRVPEVNLFNKSAILISTMISSDLIIGFTQAQDNYTDNTMYEIVIGGWYNGNSAIRKAKQGTNLIYVSTPAILSATSYRSFWITWKNGVVTAGVGNTPGNSSFMAINDATPSAVNFLALSGWNYAGTAVVKVIP